MTEEEKARRRLMLNRKRARAASRARQKLATAMPIEYSAYYRETLIEVEAEMRAKGEL